MKYIIMNKKEILLKIDENSEGIKKEYIKNILSKELKRKMRKKN